MPLASVRIYSVRLKAYWGDRCYRCTIQVEAADEQAALAQIDEYAEADGYKDFEVSIRESGD